MAASKKERIDQLLVQRGLAPSRERAQALIMAGDVSVNGQKVSKPGTLVAPDAVCEVRDSRGELRYASRGGLKLERALDAFGLAPQGLACLDVGASTGGFTDVLLQRGARLVYAVDVGQGQLAWELRNDARVVVMERTNIRHLERLPEPAQAAVIDVSFISLRLVLPQVARLTTPGAWIVALVKPQFEAGKAEADRGAGVISDPEVRRKVLLDLLAWAPAQAQPLFPLGLIASPIRGRDGNHEYLLWLEKQAREQALVDLSQVEEVLRAEALPLRDSSKTSTPQ
ncbi:MAG TPA: TlyA family RNA methyltransferase [Ktedonobacterales bacterium]|jgi:23S rRNA (cytidine1920-2'-O)/16S rRNA (cytidine1409-2'-O)-methyltransferase